MSGTIKSSTVSSAGGFSVKKSDIKTRGDNPADMYRKALNTTIENINHANELLYNIHKKHHEADMEGACIAPYALQLCIDPSTKSLGFDPSIDQSDLGSEQKESIIKTQIELLNLEDVTVANRFYKHPGFLAKAYKGGYKGVYVVGIKDIKHGLSEINYYLSSIPKAIVEILKLSKSRKLTASTFNIVYHMTSKSKLETFINSGQFAYPEITTSIRESKERSTGKKKQVVYCTGATSNVENCLSSENGNILSFIRDGHGYFSSSVLMNLFSLHAYYMKINGTSIKNTPEKLMSYGAIEKNENQYVSKVNKKLTSLMGSSHVSPLMQQLFTQDGRFTSEKASGKIDPRYFGHSAIQSIVSDDIVKVSMTFRWPEQNGGDGKTHAKLAFTAGGPDAISFCDYVKTFVIRQDIELQKQLVYEAYLRRINSNSPLVRFIINTMIEAKKSDKLSEKQKNKGMCIIGTEITSINAAASNYLKENIVSAINAEIAAAEAAGRVPNTAQESRNALTNMIGSWTSQDLYSEAILSSDPFTLNGVQLPGFDDNIIFGMLQDKQVLSSMCTKINLYKAFQESIDDKRISDYKKSFEQLISETQNITKLHINQYSTLISSYERVKATSTYEYENNQIGKTPKELETLLNKIANAEVTKYVIIKFRDIYTDIKEKAINMKRLVSSLDDANDTVKLTKIEELKTDLIYSQRTDVVETTLRANIAPELISAYNAHKDSPVGSFSNIYAIHIATILKHLGIQGV